MLLQSRASLQRQATLAEVLQEPLRLLPGAFLKATLHSLLAS